MSEENPSTLTNPQHKSPKVKPRTFVPQGSHANRRVRWNIKWSIPQRYCTYLRSLCNLAATSKTVNASVPLKMDLQCNVQTPACIFPSMWKTHFLMHTHRAFLLHLYTLVQFHTLTTESFRWEDWVGSVCGRAAVSYASALGSVCDYVCVCQ